MGPLPQGYCRLDKPALGAPAVHTAGWSTPKRPRTSPPPPRRLWLTCLFHACTLSVCPVSGSVVCLSDYLTAIHAIRSAPSPADGALLFTMGPASTAFTPPCVPLSRPSFMRLLHLFEVGRLGVGWGDRLLLTDLSFGRLRHLCQAPAGLCRATDQREGGWGMVTDNRVHLIPPPPFPNPTGGGWAPHPPSKSGGSPPQKAYAYAHPDVPTGVLAQPGWHTTPSWEEGVVVICISAFTEGALATARVQCKLWVLLGTLPVIIATIKRPF